VNDPTPAVLGGPPAFDAPLYCARARRPPDDVLAPLLAEVMESRWFTNNGDKVRRLEEELARALGAGFVRLTCNGTIALLLALRALGTRGSVVTTPFTFPATAHAIAWNGLTPVFADIDPVTKNLDPAAVETACDDTTTAILAVHVFGVPCDVDALEAIARRRGLRVLYDAAHAFGVRVGGRPIAAHGDLSVFSFHATKLFHSCEGGAVVGHDPALAAKIDSLRNFGILDEEHVEGVGINGKLSEFHAAVGLALLPGTADEIGARSTVDATYREELADCAGLSFVPRDDGVEPNHAYFPVDVDPDAFGLTRDELHAALREDNVFARKYFHPLCTENRAYRDLPSADPSRLPQATRVAGRVLTLPMYGELALEDVHRIASRIRAIRARAPEVRARLATRLR